MENELINRVNILKEEGFDVIFKPNKRELVIEIMDYSICFFENIIHVSRDGDSESFDVDSPDFINTFNIPYHDTFLTFRNGRYVDFDFSQKIRTQNKDKVFNSIIFLVFYAIKLRMKYTEKIKYNRMCYSF